MTHGVQRDVGAGFHIIDAGPIDLVTLTPDRVFRVFDADRMHGVQVR